MYGRKGEGEKRGRGKKKTVPNFAQNSSMLIENAQFLIYELRGYTPNVFNNQKEKKEKNT